MRRHLGREANNEQRERFTVIRNHIFYDTLHIIRRGKVNLGNHLKVTFIGEPAVDAGGPLREFFQHIISEIAENNSLFCGITTARTPRHNVVELEKKNLVHLV